MKLTIEAQKFEEEKEQQLWWSITKDFLQNLEDEIRGVLRERAS